jgi:hypothetical protein
VGLEPLYSVGDVDSLLLEELAPGDVRRLVEAGGDLHQHGDLFSPSGRLRQRAYDRRVAAGAVDRQLDGEDVRVLGCRLDEPTDGGVEAHVGVVEEDVPAGDLLEDRDRVAAVDVPEPRVGDGLVERKAEIRPAGRLEFQQGVRPDDRLRDVDVLVAGPELLAEPPQPLLGHRRIHLKAGDPGEPPGLQLAGDLPDDAPRLSCALLQGEIGVLFERSPGPARGAEAVHGAWCGREHQVQIRRDHLLERDEAAVVREGHPAGPVVRHLQPNEALPISLSLGQDHRQVQPQVADEGEGMLGVRGQRGENRLHGLPEIVAEQALLPLVHLVVIDDRDAFGGEKRPELVPDDAAQDPVLVGELFTHRLKELLRSAAARRDLAGALLHASLQPTEPLHRELVVEHPHDPGEADPLHQRDVLVPGHCQDAAGEGEPAQLPVEELLLDLPLGRELFLRHGVRPQNNPEGPSVDLT